MRHVLPRPSLRQLPHRIGVSAVAIKRFLTHKPAYLIFAIVIATLFYELIFWSLNLGLAGYLLTTPFLGPSERFAIFASSFTSLFTQPTSSLGTLLLLVSLLQGISLSMLIYTIRYERQQARSFMGAFGGAGLAGILSVFGLGCTACGTSLVTPLLTFLFATSSIAAAERVGEMAALLALIVAVITLYLSGLKLSARG